MEISITKIPLELKVNWKLSRNETLLKENFILATQLGERTVRGEIAPNIRYGETEEVILENFERFKLAGVESSKELKQLFSQGQWAHSFQFGIESLLVQREALSANKTVWEYLGLEKPQKIATSFSVPIMELADLPEYLGKLQRFPYIKIKVSQDNAIDFVTAVAKETHVPLRIDGNEGFTDFDSYKRFEEKVSKLNIQFIEQPLPSTSVEEYQKLKKDSLFEIMADESIENTADFEKLSTMFHSINIKLMKTGGYYNAIRLLNEAKSHGMKCMIGCMIETSLGISSAMNLYSLGDYFDLDGSLLIKNDPFELIRETEGRLTLP